MNQNRPSLRQAAQRGSEAKRQQVQPGGKPPPPVVRTEKVKAACGHDIDFGLFDDNKDKVRDARRQKKMGQLCPACREQKEREQQEAAAARRAEKKQQQQNPEQAPNKHGQLQERLPDGSRFHVVYDAAKQEWSGTLTIGSDAFTSSASGLFKLLMKLDRLYRHQQEALAQDVPAAAAGPEGQ